VEDDANAVETRYMHANGDMEDSTAMKSARHGATTAKPTKDGHGEPSASIGKPCEDEGEETRGWEGRLHPGW